MKQITVMVDDVTHRVLTEVAADEDRTLGKQSARVLRQWAEVVAEEDRPLGKPGES